MENKDKHDNDDDNYDNNDNDYDDDATAFTVGDDACCFDETKRESGEASNSKKWEEEEKIEHKIRQCRWRRGREKKQRQVDRI